MVKIYGIAFAQPWIGSMSVYNILRNLNRPGAIVCEIAWKSILSLLQSILLMKLSLVYFGFYKKMEIAAREIVRLFIKIRGAFLL